MGTSTTINIPQGLIFEMNHDSDRGICKSLVALCICMKMYSGTSTITSVTPYKIHKAFKCSLNKAKMLLEEAKGSDLFSFSNKGHITARNLKKLFWEEHNYKGKTQHSLMVSKIKASQEIRLSAIEKELNRLSISMVINAADRRHELNMVGVQLLQETKDSRREHLSINYIAKAVGLSARQVIRYMNTLVKENVIARYKGKRTRLGRAEETENLDRTFIYNFDSFKQEPNTYQIKDWWERNRHCHLIVEHLKRRRISWMDTIYDL